MSAEAPRVSGKPMDRKRRLGKLFRDSRAATAVEYGLIMALVVLVLIGALVNLADTTVNMWNNISDRVTNA